MSRTRSAAIWLALFVAALTLGVLFEDGLPEHLTDSIVPFSERPVRLAERVRDRGPPPGARKTSSAPAAP